MPTVTEPTAADPITRPRGRWRLGILTLMGVAAVIIGVAVFGGEEETTLPTLPNGLAPPPGSPRSGEAAPNFVVEAFDGTTIDLEAHLRDDGRPILLNFWASWCGPCRAEMPALDAAAAVHPEALIVGIAVRDDLVPAQEFADEVGVSYPLAFDVDSSVERAYPVPGLPATFSISSDGEIIRVVFGELETDEIESLIAELTG